MPRALLLVSSHRCGIDVESEVPRRVPNSFYISEVLDEPTWAPVQGIDDLSLSFSRLENHVGQHIIEDSVDLFSRVLGTAHIVEHAGDAVRKAPIDMSEIVRDALKVVVAILKHVAVEADLLLDSFVATAEVLVAEDEDRADRPSVREGSH